MKKRLLALALCLVMLIGMIPAALAGDPAGDPASDGGATELKKYVIHYDANEGTLIGAATAEVAPQNTETGETGLIPQRDATRNGYKLKGWNWGYTKDASEGEWDFTIPLTKTPVDVYLKANWQVKQYTLTYELIGLPGASFKDSAQSTQTLDYGATLDLLTADALNYDTEGYTFEGWTADPVNETPWTSTTMPAENVTLYSVFRAKSDKVYVHFDGNGETGGVMADQAFTKGETKTLTKNTFTRTGYEFLGWSRSENAVTPEYLDEESFKHDQESTVILYAVWKLTSKNNAVVGYYDYNLSGRYTTQTFVKDTTITVNTNGGYLVFEGSKITSADDEKSFKLTDKAYYLSEPEKTGYTFAGWSFIKRTNTFFANWTKNPTSSTYDVYYYDYTDSKYEYYRFDAGTYLVFDPNGGTAKLNNTSFSSQKGFYIYDDYILSDAVRTGYTFYGWYLTKSGSTYTFTAMWSKSASTVPYMLNGEDHYAYIKGYPNGSFKPNATITRAEAASIFYRLLTDTTRKTYTTTYNTFKDVPAKAWYNTAVSTMAKLGIVNGDANGYFRPSDPITRAEIAAMIARCDGSYYGSSYTNFSDVKGHWASSYIARAYELGWINGYGTTYAPDKYISRAETVAILNRVLNRAPQYTSDLLSGRNTFSDVSTASWYYLDVEEAANSHTYTRKTSGYEYWNKLIADPSWL